MISNAQLTPVLPVVDVSRATGFYRDRLGLKDVGDDQGGNHLLQTGSGARIALMTAEEGAQSSHTVLTFEVEDITNEVKDLKSRGVGFYDSDLPDLKPPTMWLSWAPRRLPGLPTPRATFCACTR
jgi:catechol 2,3-dioxygenase-like lactoylglutathione lyase family enzyme